MSEKRNIYYLEDAPTDLTTQEVITEDRDDEDTVWGRNLPPYSKSPSAHSACRDPAVPSADLPTKNQQQSSPKSVTDFTKMAAVLPYFVKVGKPIGRGRFGRVYRAIDADTLEMLAVKEMQLGGIRSDNQTILQAETELSVLKRQMGSCDHGCPCVIAYRGAHFDPYRSTLCLVMDRAVCSLQQFMDARAPSVDTPTKTGPVIPLDWIRSVARDVLKGLSHMHTVLEIGHLDLKPSNVLISSEGRASLSDFGTARDLSPSRGAAPLSGGEEDSPLGTINYMSPERLLGKSNCDVRSDIWSAGMTILACCLGGHPLGSAGLFWDVMDGIETVAADVKVRKIAYMDL